MGSEPQPLGPYAEQVLGATERAMERAAAIAGADLKSGLNTLATITCAAPLVGLLGTIWALISNTFLGVSGERSSDLGYLAERISWAIVPTALGILVALPAFWGHRYSSVRVEEFESEIKTFSLSVIGYLRPHAARLRSKGPVQESLPFLEAYSRDLATSGGYRRYGAFITGVLLVTGFVVQMVLRRSIEFDVPLYVLIPMSLGTLTVMFCCAWLPVYAVWVDFLHRKPNGVVAPIAAALALVWCLAE